MLGFGRRHSDDEQWAPISDLMAVMMLVFMLIAMILFVSFDLEKRDNDKRCKETRAMLDKEFKDYFKDWGAVLDEDLTFRFTSQRVLFESNSSDISSWFAETIKVFFPRYMEVIARIRDTFGLKEVLAIRIDGHTSSEWEGEPDEDKAYMNNMELSQERARNIVEYALALPDASTYTEAVYELITANGLSSSKLICAKGEEDKQASRRVEFKLLTKSCQDAGVYDKVQRFSHRCSEENHADEY